MKLDYRSYLKKIINNMEFDPRNNIVKLCIQGMDMEAKGHLEEAGKLFLQAWNEGTNDFEKYLGAFFVAKNQKVVRDRLKWLETTLQYAQKINDDSIKESFSTLYTNIAKCYEELGDIDNAKKNQDLALSFRGNPSDKGP